MCDRFELLEFRAQRIKAGHSNEYITLFISPSPIIITSRVMHCLLIAVVVVAAAAPSSVALPQRALERFARINPDAVAHAVEAAQAKARAVLDAQAQRGPSVHVPQPRAESNIPQALPVDDAAPTGDGLEGECCPSTWMQMCSSADSLSEKGLFGGLGNVLGHVTGIHPHHVHQHVRHHAGQIAGDVASGVADQAFSVIFG